jgi:hypothetical protein
MLRASSFLSFSYNCIVRAEDDVQRILALGTLVRVDSYVVAQRKVNKCLGAHLPHSHLATFDLRVMAGSSLNREQLASVMFGVVLIWREVDMAVGTMEPRQ